MQLPSTLATGFRETLVLAGRTHPTAIRFAPNGHAFVAEKGGVIFQYDDVINGAVVAHQVLDIRDEVHDFWDRGLLGLAVHPSYPQRPEIYIAYTHDAFADGTGPRWGDQCPNPPGATSHGCVVYGRLSRVVIDLATMTGTEEPLISSKWCQQYPSHSVGDLRFGPDGYLYMSAGEGASFTFADYGQDENPCGDPPNPAGTPDDVIATAEGGRLRSQDILTDGDPVGLSGAILRLDVSGAAVQIPPDNPLVGKGTSADDAVIGIGLRNPFRWTFRPGTRELWIGDVGDASYEELDRLVDPTTSVTNFGWPCYEGPEERPTFRGNVLCDRVYARDFPTFVSPMTVADPFLSYRHADPFVPGDTTCGGGTSSISGLAFNDKTLYPAAYRNALFLADGSRRCIWSVAAGTDGIPDPAQRAPFLQQAGGTIADLQMGPDGRLYYVSFESGSVYRIDYSQGNQPPQALVTANPTSGLAPLVVTLDASASTDAEDGTNLSYAWDLDGDGQFDDATGVTVVHTFTRSGVTTVSVMVTDTLTASAVAQLDLNIGNTPPEPVIATPAASQTWVVGQTIPYAGSATDLQDGALPASALTWELIMHHCRSESMTDCHAHAVLTARGVSSGSFVAPDHEWPSFLELKLTAIDNGSEWYDAGWPYRRGLVLDNRAQASTLTNFPVLVTLTPARIDYTKTQPGGRDLRFTDTNGVLLSHEIESWNPGGTSLVWVRVPRLVGAAANTIYVYFGNATATDAQSPGAVWSEGYVGVWHLGASLDDSSPYGRTGIGQSTSLAAAGAVGAGTAFNGSTSYIDLGTSPVLELVDNLTIEAWAKVSNGNFDGYPRILSKKAVWNGAAGYSLEPNPSVDRVTLLGAGSDTAVGATPVDGLFHYYAASIAGTTAVLYADGADVSIDGSLGSVVASSDPLTIGRASGGDFLDGVIDEVRLSSVARSSDWIAAQYLSMRDQMITYGAEESSTALGTSVSVMLQPQTALVSFTSDPDGLTLQVASDVVTTPHTQRFIVGSGQTVTAPTPQTLAGTSYAFSSWSDGQPATHLYTVPASDSALHVVYTALGPVTDSDGDGMPDSWETTYGLNPGNPGDASLDRDGDRLSNLEEFGAGTDPTRTDSDGDGWDDFTEATFGGDPTDPAVVPVPPQVTISAPAAGAQLPEPNVSVVFGVSGPMLPGDHVGLALDGGAEVSISGSTGMFTFTGVTVGAHSLRAQLRDAGGIAYTHAGSTVTVDFTVTSVATCAADRLTIASAQASSVEVGGYPASAAIDGSLATRWSSAFSDPQWIVVDLGAERHVSRVVLRWEAAASRDYDIAVGSSATGPWTTLYTNPAGDGGVDDIGGLSATGRYVRMYSRQRTTPYGNSMWELEVYGDNDPSCGSTTGGPVCGNGLVESGEQCDDGNTVNDDACSNTCVQATCSDGQQNQGETGVDCGGPCAACAGDGCQAIALAAVAASASSVENAGYPASAAIDGNLTTRWASAFSDPQWIIVDLGAPRHVSRVVLRWEAAASRDYDIAVGSSATGPWTTLYTNPAGDGGVDDIGGLSATGQYVRMFSRARTTAYGNSLFELEVYGDNNPSCASGAPVCGNGVVETGEECDDGNTVNDDACSNGCVRATCNDAALNQGETGVDCGGPCPACSGTTCLTDRLPAISASASSVENARYPASAAIDGSLTTRWSSAFSDPQWIVVDLGAAAHVSRVVLRWEKAASADYDIDVSDSASGPWTTVHANHAGDGGTDDITGLSANGRFVRMYSRARTTKWGNSIWELEIYGDPSTSCTP